MPLGPIPKVLPLLNSLAPGDTAKSKSMIALVKKLIVAVCTKLPTPLVCHVPPLKVPPAKFTLPVVPSKTNVPGLVNVPVIFTTPAVLAPARLKVAGAISAASNDPPRFKIPPVTFKEPAVLLQFDERFKMPSLTSMIPPTPFWTWARFKVPPLMARKEPVLAPKTLLDTVTV